MKNIDHVRVEANGSRYTTSKTIAEADKLKILATEPAVDRFGVPLPPEPLPAKKNDTPPATPAAGDKK